MQQEKLDKLAEEVKAKLASFKASVDNHEKEMLTKIEEAKDDAMRTAVEELTISVNRRLSAIEATLAELKEEE